jgi:hypothetical protein
MHGAPPAEADLQHFFGVTPPAVHDMVIRLQQAGLVSRSPGQARSIRVRIPDDEIPALDDREASSPLADRRRGRGLSIAPAELTNDSDVEDGGFPKSEIFVDCCGTSREFAIDLLVNESGYFLRATERAEGENGYAFAASAESDPYLALGRLRQKISKGLSTRYLVPGKEPASLTHFVASGHISFDGVVIDGRHVDYGDLARILTTHEGWQFNLEIVDPYDAF